MSSSSNSHVTQQLFPNTQQKWLAQLFLKIRQRTETICQPLAVEDYVVQSMNDVSPPKWHLAHTSWFFEELVLKRFASSHKPFNEAYGYIFNSYYETIGSHLARHDRGVLSRPPTDEIRAYRQHIDHAVLSLLVEQELPEEALTVIELGCNHEEQHQELLLTDIKYNFFVNPLRPLYRPQPLHLMPEEAPTPMRWLSVKGGIYSIGAQAHEFSQDHERPRHEVMVQDFAMASRLVTNQEFTAFIDAGGYERPEFWLSDGWDWRRTQNITAPLYWWQRDGKWWEFTLRGVQPLHDATPVSHVSFYEADAYARWADARLPREEEWEIIAAKVKPQGVFFESECLHPQPAKQSEDSPSQLFGDLWEWTQSAYGTYPGHQAPKGPLREYNGKFAANQYVLRGGSCGTPRHHIRATYRNYFPATARWQFSGIRLARNG